jgi:hypothetical protein
MRNSEPPKTNAAPHCFHPSGSCSLRRSITQAKTRAPAARWRIAIERNGGMSRTTIAIARKVDPQTT